MPTYIIGIAAIVLGVLGLLFSLALLGLTWRAKRHVRQP